MTRASTPAPSTNSMPPKTIPPNRDRLQSQILVWITAPLILMACVQLVRLMILESPSWNFYLAKALALSVAFAFAAWAPRAATPLFTLFLLTFLATRAGRKRKADRGLAESRKGRRASQVIANLGMAALVSNLVGDRVISWLLQSRNTSPGEGSDFWILHILILAVLAEATADSVSSEIGQAFGGRPILLTTLRRVETGVDGAITMTGTVAGILAATIVIGAGAWTMHLHADQVCIALAAATLGLFFDSLLGATVERKGWIGNDLVNFASTAFAAAIVFPVTRLAGFFSC